MAVFAAAAAKALRTPAAKKAAVELTAAAATRIRQLLNARHKVRFCGYNDGVVCVMLLSPPVSMAC